MLDMNKKTIPVKSICGAFLLLTSFATAGCSPDKVTLTAGNAQVVIAPDAPKTVRFAAEELTNFLAQVLGGEVPIVHEAKAKGEGEQRTVNIVLGTNAWSAAAGLHPGSLPRDSFIIKVGSSAVRLGSLPSPNTIFIAGRDDPKADPRAGWKAGQSGEIGAVYERATLFGVYDFLERFAGVRFYFPGPLGTIVPKTASIEVPVGTVAETPDFVKRMWYSPGGALMEGEDLGVGWKPWENRQVGYIQMLRLRRFTAPPLVHGLRHFQLKERFAKSHPEYFAAHRTKDGKVVHDPGAGSYVHICWSSGVMDEIYRDVRAFLKGESAASRGYTGDWSQLAFFDGLASITPDDGFRGCDCDKCRAFYPDGKMEGQYASELVWSKTAELGRRLKAEGVRGRIEQHAYSFYTRRPERCTLPDNIFVGYCCNGPWDERNPNNREKKFAELEAWHRLASGAKVSLHNWALKYSRTNIPDLPCVTPRSVGSFYAKAGEIANGVYMESSSDRYAHVYLNCYILAKMTWNHRFDYEAAIAEHHRLMFGPAAPEMARLYDEMEDLWVGRIMNGPTEMNALGPVQRTPSKFEIWRSIYTEERLAEWTALFDRAAAKVDVENRCRCRKDVANSTVDLDLRPRPDNLYARRIELMRRNLLEPVVKARQAFVEGTDAAREEARRAREGVKNLLDKEYAYSFDVPEGAADPNHEARPVRSCARIPFAFKPSTTYRLSFFLEAENVKPQSGYSFCGALVGIWSDRPQRWNFSFGTGAVVGSTAGRVHQSMILKTTADFEAKEISVWLRGATGKMKVDGLILEEVE